MKIVVLGGSGLIGSKLVQNLRALGHETLGGSSRTGQNALTGEGLAEAFNGASVVVDVMNSPSWEDAAVLDFFETTSRNISAAETEAGVQHHVALSVVGTDRLQASGYFRAKLAQEELIQASGIPYTIVRATQFFEFIGAIADFGTEGATVRLPSALMQPMAAEDVASLLCDSVVASPINAIDDIAGPEALGIDEIVRRFLHARSDPRTVITDPSAGYYGMPLSERSLVPIGPARLGRTHLKDWLATYQPLL